MLYAARSTDVTDQLVVRMNNARTAAGKAGDAGAATPPPAGAPK